MDKSTIFIILLVVVILLFILSLLFYKKHHKIFLVLITIGFILEYGIPAYFNNIQYMSYDTTTTTEKYKISEMNFDGSFKYYIKDKLKQDTYKDNQKVSIVVDNTIKKPILEKHTTIEKQKTTNKFMDVLYIYNEKTTITYELVLPQSIYDKMYLYRE